MTIVPALLFCSLLLVAGSVVLFVWSAKQGDCHEADRLCLLPLDDDDEPGAGGHGVPAPSHPSHPNEQSHGNHDRL
jgi:hypothetical protein